MLLYHATLSPLTAIEHSRYGSAWPAKMAPSPAAANIRSCRIGNDFFVRARPALEMTRRLRLFAHWIISDNSGP